jgi:hypothetical protein
MAIPNVSGALRGWLTKREVYIITKLVVEHRVVFAALVVIMPIMAQPLQPAKVARKPEEQRTWKWFEIITKRGELELKIDTQVWIGGLGYKIESIQPWDEGGYRRYEATQDFAGGQPQYKLSYSGNGGEGHNPATYAYVAAATAIAAANPYQLEGFYFSGWNTEEDGYGTAYAPGATITIGTASIVLYAQWEAVP